MADGYCSMTLCDSSLYVRSSTVYLYNGLLELIISTTIITLIIMMVSVLPEGRSAVLSVTPDLQHLRLASEVRRGGFPLASSACIGHYSLPRAAHEGHLQACFA